MKLIFEHSDIEQMLIEKAKSMGLDVDTVEIDTGYGYFKSAFKSAKVFKKEAPAEDATPQ